MKKILISASIIFMLPFYASAISSIEAGKIEFLISSVENSGDLKFTRNGYEHDSKEAGRHLRLKLAKGKKHINNVDDFIRICSRSYLTGEAYLIIFPDGRIIKAENFFRIRLQEYKNNPVKSSDQK